jgi:phosphatidylglycerophosphate synthase
VRPVTVGPLVGLLAEIVLLCLLSVSVGLTGPGWCAGMTVALGVAIAWARGLSALEVPRIGPADWVTLTRAVLVGAITALTIDSFLVVPQTALVVGLSVVTLSLDAVDGWVARRTSTVSPLGARFDYEVDAFLILVLGAFVAPSAGWWVLVLGLARYAFVAAGWVLPWMQASLPPRYWRKVVAATQGIVLTVVAAGVLPHNVDMAALLVAFALLAESFGRDVWWLWRHRTSMSTAPVPERALA